MKLTKIKDIAELIGITAIIASLIFIGMEVRQDQVIARSQLGSDSFDFLRSINQQLADVTFSEVFIKMIDAPEDLTLEEMTRVNAFLEQVVEVISREGYLVAQGIFTESDQILHRLGPKVFGNRYAQAWFRANKSSLNPSFVARAAPIIESYETNDSREIYSRIRDDLQ